MEADMSRWSQRFASLSEAALVLLFMGTGLTHEGTRSLMAQ